MDTSFPLSSFHKLFPDNDACLEEIKRLRYPKGITCKKCNKITKQYKLQNRTAYSCSICRAQVYPLSGTIFEKSTTPLTSWFYAFYLMTQTRGSFTGRQLQKELHVTYKTAWRMRKNILSLMKQNNADLLSKQSGEEQTRTWTFFNRFEFTVAEKVNK